MHNKTDATLLVGKFITRVLYCAALTVIIVVSYVAAETTGAIAQNFKAGSSGIEAGELVGLKHKSQNTVEPSNNSRLADIIGVVAANPLVELGEGGDSVQVVTSGVTQTLVSNINGEIESGDKVTASPINGVGMKATEPMIIVGTAQADLSSVKTKEHSIRDREGKEQVVKIGFLPVEVRVSFHAATEVQTEFIPPFLQNTANTLAGKPVDPVRVIASIMVLLLALISVMVLLYSSVRSSIISIGRNPLSERAVHKGLIEVGITVIGILSLTFITVYLILVT